MSIPSYAVLSISSSVRAVHGGAYRAITELSYLLERHFKHTLLIIGDDETKLRNTYSVKSLFSNNYGLAIKIRREVFQILKRSNLVISHGFYLFTTLLIITTVRDKPIWIIPHGSLDRFNWGISPMKKMLFDTCFRLLARNHDIRFVTTSIQESKDVVEKFPEFQVRVIPLGLSQSNLPKSLKSKVSPINSLKLLSFSRIAKKKRIDLMIQAVRLLVGEGLRVKLTIAGNGDRNLERKLMELAESVGISDCVEFIGWVDESKRDEIYANHDIFLLPSESENFGYAIAESIINATPVIISRYTGLTEFVQHYRCGEVIDNLSPVSLCDAIRLLSSHLEKYEKNCFESRELLTWRYAFPIWEDTIVQELSLKD